MKKLLALACVLIILILTGVTVSASDISGALWSGIVRIANNSTAASTVSVNFTANTSVLIAGGYMNSSGNNTSLQIGGSDVAYMPGYEGAPWMVYAGTINANSIIDGTLYMGGETDMGSKLRTFGTLEIPDTPSLALGDNYTVSYSGYVDTSTVGVITESAGEISIYTDGSENVSAVIWTANNTAEADATSILSGNYTGSDDSEFLLNGTQQGAQTFTISTGLWITSANLTTRRAGSPGTITVSIRNTLAGNVTGSDLTSGTANANTWDTSSASNKISLAPRWLAPGVYALVARCDDAGAGNTIDWRADITASTYGGDFVYSLNNGASWIISENDFLFSVAGTTTLPADISVSEVTPGEKSVTLNSDGAYFWMTVGDP